MEENKTHKSLIIVATITSVLMCILVLAETLFICLNYDKIINNESSKKTVESSNNSSNIEEIDIKSQMIKELYDMIPVYDADMSQENAYQSYKTTIDNMNNSFLLANAFKRITIPEEEKEKVEDFGDDWYYFNPNILQDEVIKLYGRELPNESFSVDSSTSCIFDGQRYQYGYGTMSSMTAENVRKITRAYKENDYLYIEDEYLYIENIGFGNETGTFIYETSDKSNLVAKYSFEEKLAGNVVLENLNNMKKYKHTFIQDTEDNTYHWVSTEPISN